MKSFVYVALGGGAGAIIRHIITGSGLVSLSVSLLLINIAGSFLIGLLTGAASSKHINEAQLLFLSTGFCGGLTTFSAFAGESYNIGAQSALLMLIYVVSTALLGIMAAYSGRRLTAKRGRG